MKKVIGVAWFTDSKNVIGIILTHDKTRGTGLLQQYRAFIGVCLPGVHQKFDELHIMEHGAKFPLLHAWQIIDKQGEILDANLFDKFPQ